MTMKKAALAAVLLGSAMIAHAGPFGLEVAAGTSQFSGEGAKLGDLGAYGLNLTYRRPTGLGAELGVRRHGRLTISDGIDSVRARVDSTQLGLTYDFPLGGNWALGARLGVHFWESKGTVLGDSDKTDGTDPYAALGAKYFANDNLSIGVFYSYYRLKDSDLRLRAKSVDLRVGYSF
jgi:opacity protein-like surface antigen